MKFGQIIECWKCNILVATQVLVLPDMSALRCHAYISGNAPVPVLQLLHNSQTNIKVVNDCLVIKTHSRVSAAKKDVRHTRVLFTGISKSPFSTPHISITTRPISIKFMYYMPSIYTIWHTK